LDVVVVGKAVRDANIHQSSNNQNSRKCLVAILGCFTLFTRQKQPVKEPKKSENLRLVQQSKQNKRKGRSKPKNNSTNEGWLLF
jgi:hypothetical protein